LYAAIIGIFTVTLVAVNLPPLFIDIPAERLPESLGWIEAASKDSCSAATKNRAPAKQITRAQAKNMLQRAVIHGLLHHCIDVWE